VGPYILAHPAGQTCREGRPSHPLRLNRGTKGKVRGYCIGAVRRINHFPDYYRGNLALLNSMKHDQDHHVPGAM